MKKLIIFDFDGTLCDSLAGIYMAINMMAKKLNYPLRSLDEVRDAIGNGAKNLVGKLMPEEEGKDLQSFNAAFACYEKFYEEINAMNTTFYTGIEDMLAILKSYGYTLAILSNKPDIHIKSLVGGMFPKGQISLALGQTADIPLKPDPAAVHYIMKILGFEKSETILVGDSIVDIKTAKNAGITSIAVTWGYTAKEVLETAKADFYLESAEKAVAYFKKTIKA